MKLWLIFLVLVAVLAETFGQQQMRPRNGGRRMGVRRPLPRGARPPPVRFAPARRPGPVGPPRVALPRASVVGDRMPGLRPPKGIAEQLNRAKLKDFMQLGQFLMQRRRFHASRL